jgi:hypothetical protein
MIPCPICGDEDHEECPCGWETVAEYGGLPDLEESILHSQLVTKQ